MKNESLSSLKDDDIINKIRDSGNTKYFEVLYKRYYPKVLDKCYGLTKNRSIAKELAEDIFSKTYEKLNTFKHLSSFSSWLYSLTYNHCIDYLREKKKLHYPSWNRENEIPEIIDETDESVDSINYENFLVVLELIHTEEKALLLMKYQDNLSIKQISTALRISEDATKMRLKRARSRVIYTYTQKFLVTQN
ncbi:MAG: RNA polymerase sigma factor [Bacteroidales bacterium]|nr:RNA polymerase sigma factor [Bacteroidales bacterium]MCF8457392.1 RNA polymerase sigma factor [Bacteroidales bacterium]